MDLNENLKGEERKIVSTRLYRSEFANFHKLCGKEGVSVNAKLRAMVQAEVAEGFGRGKKLGTDFTDLGLGFGVGESVEVGVGEVRVR